LNGGMVDSSDAMFTVLVQEIRQIPDVATATP
jgi:hypothetical protein